MTITADWCLTYVLPNLQLERPFEAAHIALVPSGDERLTPIRASSAEATKLLDGFIDSRGDAIAVSALIVSRNAPQNLLTAVEPLVAYRNVVALESVMHFG